MDEQKIVPIEVISSFHRRKEHEIQGIKFIVAYFVSSFPNLATYMF